MARDAQCNHVLRSLRSLFPTRWLEEAAREAGWVQRRRKVSAARMFWTLVLGFGCGRQRSIAALRRHFERESGQSIVPSAFYDRFTPQLVRFLRHAVARACDELSRGRDQLADAARHFTDVVGIDSTIIRLHEALHRTYPGTRTNHSPAAAKLHVVMSILGRGPRSIKVTDGRTHDARVRHLGAWVRGKLLLFDLGYYCFQAFSCLHRHGGYFITRLKDRANPELVEVLDGPVTDLVRPGARLQDVLRGARRDVLDLRAELRFRRRVYRRRRSTARQVFRVVAMRNAETGRFHVYVTNVPQEMLAVEEIVGAYAARWAMELVFRELKTHYRVDELPSTKRHVVEALILTSVLTMIVSRRVLWELAQRIRAGDVRRLRPLRWARVLEANALTLCNLLLNPRSTSARSKARWFSALKREALDPNVGRWDLRDLLMAVQSTA